MPHSRLTTVVVALFTPLLGRAQAHPQSAVQIKQLVDSIDVRLKDHYIFPDKAKRMTTLLRNRVKKNAYASLTKEPEQLAAQLQQDLSQAHRDPHLMVEYNPEFARRRQRSAQQSAEETAQFTQLMKENNFMFKKVELLPGNIGYFSFNAFVEHVNEAKPIIASALGFLANTNTLIIDLRENGGGEPEMVSQLESYFFQKKTPMNSLVMRAGRDTTFYYADPAKTDGLTLSMPVYILTSSKTFSAAEDFSYAMQQAKRATIVGEVTGGGAHPMMPFSVGQGFVVQIPFARSLNPVTQTDWEGTGVLPDVNVAAANALVKAQELILKGRQAAAKTEREKQQMAYLLNALHINRDLGTLPVAEFDQMAGTYGPLVIYRDGNRLLCNLMGNKTELVHISKNLFVLDGNAQIEFVKDSQGRYSMARLLVQNGGVFQEARK